MDFLNFTQGGNGYLIVSVDCVNFIKSLTSTFRSARSDRNAYREKLACPENEYQVEWSTPPPKIVVDSINLRVELDVPPQ